MEASHFPLYLVSKLASRKELSKTRSAKYPNTHYTAVSTGRLKNNCMRYGFTLMPLEISLKIILAPSSKPVRSKGNDKLD